MAASMLRMLAWCGTTRAMSSITTPAVSIALRAVLSMASTARRNTSLPFMKILPPCSQERISAADPSDMRSQPSRVGESADRWITTAPAPSPNSTHVPRSVQSTRPERASLPMSRIVSTPPAANCMAVTRPYTKPEQAALMSIAPHFSPRLCWTIDALAGNCCSELHVARRRRPTSPGSTPAMARASRPATVDISETLPPTCLAEIPLRSLIHSSVVSTSSAKSWLVSRFSGRWVAQPVMRPWAMRCSDVVSGGVEGPDDDRPVGRVVKWGWVLWRPASGVSGRRQSG